MTGATGLSLREATRVWFQISLQTFGGPAGQIAVMQRTLVDDRRWIGQRRFLHALNFCMLLPGPEAQQLATYLGWLLHGVRGGLIAGGLFVLPGAVAMLALSIVYVRFGDLPLVSAVFAGLAATVVAIVAHAVVRVGSRALRQRALVGVAVGAFLAIVVFGVPFPLVIVAAGIVGWLLRRAPDLDDAEPSPDALISDDDLTAERPSGRRLLWILLVGVVLWVAPVVAVLAVVGPDSVLVTQGLLFGGMALITFGGAYAALSFVAEQAVDGFGWLTGPEMAHGLALAETTPGPLIMVLQFVGFVAAYRQPGSLDPWLAAALGAAITTWVTFVPCFVFVLVGAPYAERLRGNRAVASVLTGITAAVVGVIASLGLYLAMHTLFGAVGPGPLALELPRWSTLRPGLLAIAVLSAVAVFVLRWPLPRTLAAGALLGLALGAVQ